MYLSNYFLKIFKKFKKNPNLLTIKDTGFRFFFSLANLLHLLNNELKGIASRDGLSTETIGV
jgi:hypothetical protein